MVVATVAVVVVVVVPAAEACVARGDTTPPASYPIPSSLLRAQSQPNAIATIPPLRQVDDIDSYRVVLIFKDPAEALVSRFFYNHCKNVRGADCGGSEKEFPTLGR